MMETAFVIGSLAWNTGLVGITGFLVKRWMDKQEEGVTQNRRDAKDAAKELADDLKASVIEHKAEIKDTNREINENLKGIYDQLRIANGRTSKLESKIETVTGNIETVKAVCRERHNTNV